MQIRLQEYGLKNYKKLPEYTFIKKPDLSIDQYLKLTHRYLFQKKLMYRKF